MLNKWLRDLLAQLAKDLPPTTAPTPNATGQDASDVTASVIPTSQENGYQEQPSLPSPNEVVSMKDVLQAKTLRALHEAIELHCRSMHGSGILTNFVVIAETVDADLDKETDKRSLQLLTSSDMTAWALVGYSAALSQAVYSGSI